MMRFYKLASSSDVDPARRMCEVLSPLQRPGEDDHRTAPPNTERSQMLPPETRGSDGKRLGDDDHDFT